MLKKEFISKVKTYINREGINDLLDYLESTDFYTAPASTVYHGAYEGGLVEHSLNVFKMLSAYGSVNSEYDMESIAIVSLFHDLCKTNLYKVEMRNAKDENGRWIKVPYYKTDEEFPFGHGEKSVYLLMKFIELTDEEALAIRWHMGGFDQAVRGGSYALSGAYSKSKLALELHIADMRATYILENTQNK